MNLQRGFQSVMKTIYLSAMNNTVKIILGAFGAGAVIALFRKPVSNYVFTAEQNIFLDKLQPVFRDLVKKFIAEVQTKTSYSVVITSGYRPEFDSDYAYGSYHNYGGAIDCNLVKLGKWINSNSTVSEWKATGAVSIAERIGLRWGGDFSKPDVIHFDFGKKYSTLQLHNYLLAQKVPGNKIRVA